VPLHDLKDAVGILKTLVAARRRDDGTWRTEGRWWKRPESKGSNVEVVDWGEAANGVLTARAREVLSAAKHL